MPGDLLAGISVAALVIPQSVAYADLAGLPGYVGLYSAAVPAIAAALFASSRYLQTGPVTMTSLLTLGALAGLAPVGSARYAGLASLLAVLVGVIRLGVGLTRSGFVAYLMSKPVLVGFTAAAAVLAIASQLPDALGTEHREGHLLVGAFSALWAVADWRWPALVLALATLVLMMGGRRLHPLFPGALLAVVIGLMVARVTPTQDGVGPVTGGVLRQVAGFELGLVPNLLVPALVVALVGFAETASVARAYATRDREQWNPHREFVSQGIASLVSGLGGGYAVEGSLSRTSVGYMAGARTRWSEAITGLAVLGFLPFAGLLTPLPRGVPAAIVIAAAVGLIQVGEIRRLWRSSRPQSTVAGATFAATLILAPRIDLAVLLGVVFGIAWHLYRERRVTVHSHYQDGTLTLQPIGVLYFGSAPDLDGVLSEQLAAHPEATTLVLDLTQLGRVDYTGADLLWNFAGDAQRAGLSVALAGVPPQNRKMLARVWNGELPEAAI